MLLGKSYDQQRHAKKLGAAGDHQMDVIYCVTSFGLQTIHGTDDAAYSD
jgi:hypothetical protein